jgi:hypothetical protein
MKKYKDLDVNNEDIPCRRVLTDKLEAAQLIKKFAARCNR